MKPPKATCNYCQGELTVIREDILSNNLYNYVCNKPACPCFSLLQIPEEQMIKLEKVK